MNINWNVVIGRAREWWDLLVAAAICLFEAVVGRPTSCPACWKCTTMRWTLAAVLLAVLWGLFGGYLFLGLAILLTILVAFGQGHWEDVREFIKARVKK